MSRVFMKGCEAIAEAAVRAGCRFFAGYPITPQNEIPEYFSRRMPEVGGVFVQGESEVASVNMVYGAASAGVRAMTSSSSPGIALKSEGISYCAAARIPMVYANISRGGPGVGSIQPAQMDYFQATKASGNGGFQMMVFAPSTVQEAVDMTYAAFDYADRDRNPVLILADGVIPEGVNKTNLAQLAFGSVLGDSVGSAFVAVCLFFFAFSTVLSWNLFGKINVIYLFGKKAAQGYAVIALVFLYLGTVMSNDLVWELTDMFNNLMVLPNAIALFALTGMVLSSVHKAANKGQKIEK